MQDAQRVLLCLCALAPCGAADTPAAGYQLAPPQPHLSPGAMRSLSTGERVGFDGFALVLWSADGASSTVLGSFPAEHWSGVFAIDPSESFVLLGESGEVNDPLQTPSGELYRVPLDGSGPALLTPDSEAYLTTLVFNFDADFESSQSALISAATGGFGTGNSIVRLDLESGATQLVAQVDGPSGPLAVSASGLLWYATQTDDFPSPPGATDVIFWTPAQLASGAVLGQSDAIVYASGFDGASDLLVEPGTGALLLAENSLALGTNRLRFVGPGTASSPVLVEGATPGAWLSGLQAFASTTGSTFQAYQPQGARVEYTRTEFGVGSVRVSVLPRRASASFAGPGAQSGASGAVELLLADAPPLGTAWLLVGGSTTSQEQLLPSFGGLPPLFVGLPLDSSSFLSAPLAVSAQGQAQLGFRHDGSLHGALATQALLLGPSGALLGTSSSASL